MGAGEREKGGVGGRGRGGEGGKEREGEGVSISDVSDAFKTLSVVLRRS